MANIFNTKLSNEQATVAFGAAIAASCFARTTLYLHGDLGAGKTTFSRGFIQFFGHSGQVKSPTYTLVESYQLFAWQIYHFDLYRLDNPEELEFIGIRDYFTPDALCLVEWPEKGKDLLPEPDLNITLKYDGKQRAVQVKTKTHAGYELIERLKWN
ncbi:tRNA (adenosine(37)-N6)-threonylcarbamoyltransferase complex ATPase subunit type 1 TsaE [Candidatus Enterovibrio altilux]|uniref:tRNA threonylcarbamoyladenosine biosynthesis protein TsaE n=1 Tax=Candidatus Enterovibrio altilux TaxID=1927128 RepID=A0A291B8V9_9GAMM|nr:tRNA (adenosine(37)-N6)-threonylcarbamoyltransferase complex ATPase subunit type 1 TsaE [Candidatus Enterovibrio luxaltus]ATF09456.1 TsaE protein, required for threonylcarbamoyladenosine t(6)A37 formation in tRNA [Candidatus Enterovibrio luxaltus]